MKYLLVLIAVILICGAIRPGIGSVENRGMVLDPKSAEEANGRVCGVFIFNVPNYKDFPKEMMRCYCTWSFPQLFPTWMCLHHDFPPTTTTTTMAPSSSSSSSTTITTTTSTTTPTTTTSTTTPPPRGRKIQNLI